METAAMWECASMKSRLRCRIDWKGRDIYLEIGAAGSVAEVVVNGQPVGTHKGGYSLFRFNITKWIETGAVQPD